MNELFGDLFGQGVEIYLDDILIHGKNKEEVERLTKEVLTRIEKNQLLVKPEKCLFYQDKIEFLGLLVTGDRVEMDPGKLNAIHEWQASTSVKGVQ